MHLNSQVLLVREFPSCDLRDLLLTASQLRQNCHGSLNLAPAHPTSFSHSFTLLISYILSFFYFHFFVPRTIRLSNQPSLLTIAPLYTFVTLIFPRDCTLDGVSSCLTAWRRLCTSERSIYAHRGSLRSFLPKTQPLLLPIASHDLRI